MPKSGFRAEVDPDRFLAVLKRQRFRAHPSRRDEWLSETCLICGTGRTWRVMANIRTGYVNCYGCGRGWRSPFRWFAESHGVSIEEAVQEIGAEGAQSLEAAFQVVAAEIAAEQHGLRYQCPPLDGIWWWDGATTDWPEAWIADAFSAAVRRGFTAAQLAAKRIGFATSGRFVGRVIMPVFFKGLLVWFQGWDWTKTREVKYDSPVALPDTIGRRHVLAQWDLYSTAETLVLAEGLFNTWTAELAGFPAVASMGKSLSPEQRTLLLAAPARQIIIAFDADALKKTTQPLARELTGLGKTALIVRYPDDRDLNDHGVDGTRRLILAASPLDWFFDGPSIP